MRKCRPVLASSIDGKTEKVEEHFKEMYVDLYNSANDENDVATVFKDINEGITISHIYDL